MLPENCPDYLNFCPLFSMVETFGKMVLSVSTLYSCQRCKSEKNLNFITEKIHVLMKMSTVECRNYTIGTLKVSVSVGCSYYVG